jgi:thioredoxin 2
MARPVETPAGPGPGAGNPERATGIRVSDGDAIREGSHVTATEAKSPVTIRCVFCDTLNRVDLAKAANRPACGECGKPMLLDRPVKIAQDDFDKTVLGATAPVLVDFYADWCGPCRMVAPFVDEIAQKNVGRMLVAKVDTDRAPEVATRYGIRSIPTLIVFQGGAEVDRSVGFEPERVRALVARVAG